MDANSGEPWSEADISDLSNELAHGRTIAGPRHGRKCIAVAANSAAKIKKADLIGHRRNNEEPYAVPTGRSFDGKGNADDEEQRREHRLKQKKDLASFTRWHCVSPLTALVHFEA
jgi:hypothetical protein